MTDHAITIDLPFHNVGERYASIVFGPITIGAEGEETTPSGELTRVRMQFRKGSLAFTADSTATDDRDVTITITDADDWVATVPELNAFLPESGTWDWDALFFEDGHAAPWKLYKGRLMVGQPITRVP